eukprot:937467_1
MAMMALSEASNTPVNPIKITRLSVTSTQTRSPSDEMNRFPTKTSLLCHGKWIVIQENKTITIYNKNTGQTQPSFEGKCPVFGMQMLYFLVEPKLYIYHIRGDAFDDNGQKYRPNTTIVRGEMSCVWDAKVVFFGRYQSQILSVTCSTSNKLPLIPSHTTIVPFCDTP